MTTEQTEGVMLTPASEQVWRPIETAPKDRTWVLVWETGINRSKYHPAEVARFINSRWESSDKCFVNASHWMPLPQPPDDSLVLKKDERSET